MRINCPLCGERDSREFYYKGAASYLNRPAPDATAQDWDDYLHNRENPAGETRDLWQHQSGCRAWIVVTRDTNTHEIKSCRLAASIKRGDNAG